MQQQEAKSLEPYLFARGIGIFYRFHYRKPLTRINKNNENRTQAETGIFVTPYRLIANV